MTLKEAILKSLEHFDTPKKYTDIYQDILNNNYFDFTKFKTPESYVSAVLGNFIRNNDTRVKRINASNNQYLYYLSNKEININFEQNSDFSNEPLSDYEERDLHQLLTAYLDNQNYLSKTIYHERSNGKDTNQKWIHPDMVAISFVDLKNKISKSLLKTINKQESFQIISYELKKSIQTDYELKHSFFQTVSNSSWANYSFLVSFQINDNLLEEIQRLNQAFGIGVIQLKSNPFESKIIFPSKYTNLDFSTIDKLCEINPDFNGFIEKIEKILSADDRYYDSSKNELKSFCDIPLKTDTEILEYCRRKHIPIEIDQNENQSI